MKLFYIAGHGAGDPGAVGCNYQEAERVRTLGKRLKELGGDSVMLGDFKRNYYADDGISKLTLDPNEWAILEGHMDAGQSNARGGHVIIYGDYTPDDYDNALAQMISDYLPGRSNLVVARSDLANPFRAANRGYNYRLCEFGFITNWEDVKIFNDNMDDIAMAVLAAFGIVPSIGGGDKNMLCYIQRKGNDGQSLFDGFRIMGVPNIPSKQALSDVIKQATGTVPKTIVLEPQAYDYIKNMCK